MKQYYYYQDGKALGPHTREELAQLHQEGVITAETRIAADGDEAWLSYAELGAEGEAKLPALPTEENASDDPASEGITETCLHCKSEVALVKGAIPASCPRCYKDMRPKDDGIWTQFGFAFTRFATLRGRATRREFWSYTLVVILLGFFTSLFLPGGGGLVNLVTLIPSFTIMVRRFHDVNLSGWWVVLVQIVPGVMIAGTLAGFAYAFAAALGGFEKAYAAIARAFELNAQLEELTGISGYMTRQLVDKQWSTIGEAALSALWDYLALYIICLAVIPVGCTLFGLIVCCLDSKPGRNKYGLSPKYPKALVD